MHFYVIDFKLNNGSPYLYYANTIFLNKWSSLRGLNNGPVNICYSIISVTVKIWCQTEIAIGVLGIFSVSIFQ